MSAEMKGMKMVGPGLWEATRCTSIFCPHEPKCSDMEETDEAEEEARIRADEREKVLGDAVEWLERRGYEWVDDFETAIRARGAK